ncbi:MAG TPA: acyl-CoA dehydrogenase [Methyloprofundus sp.]|uniref:acyl-CoA dehydrogenase family protein n=1 Tax=Methyloprofundus sp. TaxID=2020875 RepID=UPI00179D7AAA|nr:acyl-CoA dehydrogenase family protein [Methyloprofundus sp.]HIG65816.1 acyl-CoA dehydrogenase [Methyloprofundus sp.]HIL78062.1 acyl-CoA dehydrogenase [Methylococcales bacterium]
MTQNQQFPPSGDIYASRQRLIYCAQQNILKHAISNDLGGHGDNFDALVKAHLSLGKQCQDSGLILSINAHLWGSIFPLILYGSEQQKQQWLPALLSAEMIGGHAITEPQAGSDINTIETHAIPTDSGVVLNGHKRFITNTPIADVLLIYAKLAGKLTAFLVKKTDAGAYFTDSPNVTGCATATMGDIILQDCHIPFDRQLGKTGAGGMMIQSALELERAFIFAGISGIMQWQLEQVIQFSRKRQVNGAHLGANQAISHKIAEMKCRLETCLLWINECARLKDAGKRISLTSAQTKLFASEAFLQSSLDATHIMGANGLITENKMTTLVQDALASRLFSGSSEIQKNIIAALLGTGAGFKSRK